MKNCEFQSENELRQIFAVIMAKLSQRTFVMEKVSALLIYPRGYHYSLFH
jgi:hypothetical protein